MSWIKNSIERFVIKYHNNKILNILLGSFYHLYLRNSKETRNLKRMKNNFKINGLNVLRQFDEAMTNNGYRYSLAFGTMLGAVREHGFIKHDADIDVYVWIEDYSSKMVDVLFKSGFAFKHRFTVENDTLGKEDTIEMNGVQIDIFYIYPPTEGRTLSYCCDFVTFHDCLSRETSIEKHGGLLPRRLEIPIVKEFIRVPFETLQLPIIANAHEYLSFRYGEDYMIPNAKWVNGSNSNIIEWDGKVALFIEN